LKRGGVKSCCHAGKRINGKNPVSGKNNSLPIAPEARCLSAQNGGFSENEIALIESMVYPMETDDE